MTRMFRQAELLKSDPEISDFSNVFSAVSRNLKTDTTPRQSKNAPETLTTAIWWIIPAVIAGAAAWALIIWAVL